MNLDGLDLIKEEITAQLLQKIAKLSILSTKLYVLGRRHANDTSVSNCFLNIQEDVYCLAYF